MSDIKRFLAEIGARGGRRSRRELDPETAREMVRVREASLLALPDLVFLVVPSGLAYRCVGRAVGGRAAHEARQPRSVAGRNEVVPLTDPGQLVVPRAGETLEAQGIVPHFGSPGGVLPRVADMRLDEFDAEAR